MIIEYWSCTKDGAIKFLDLIEKKFPSFYYEKKNEEFTLKPPSQGGSKVKYWKTVIGGFLAQKVNEAGSDWEATPQWIENPQKKESPLLLDATILYKIYLFAYKHETSHVFDIQLETIQRVFEVLFNNEHNYLYSKDQKNNKDDKYGTLLKKEVVKGPKTSDSSNKVNFPIIEENDWLMFCFAERSIYQDDEKILKKRGIKVAKVQFNSKIVSVGALQFQKSNSELISTYEGAFEYYNGGSLLEFGPLNSTSLGEYNLRILFDTSEKNELFVGIYYNTKDKSNLIGGSVLLIKKEKLDKIGFKITNKCEFITDTTILPPVIVNFFSERGLNFMKLPKRCYTLNQLSNELKKYQDYYQAGTFFRLHKYSLFISIPLTYNNSPEEYVRNRGVATKTKELLKAAFPEYITSIFLACENSRSLDAYMREKQDDPRYYEAFEALRSSQIFMMIFPDPLTDIQKNQKLSSSIIELGMAIALGKPVVLFCSDNVYLSFPKNIQINRPNVIRFKIYGQNKKEIYNSIEKIFKDQHNIEKLMRIKI